VQKLRWLLVLEFLRGEKLLEVVLLRSRSTLNELCLEDIIRVGVRWGKEEILNLSVSNSGASAATT